MCIDSKYICDGWDHCADRADEAEELCMQYKVRAQPILDKKLILIGIFVLFVFVMVFACTKFGRTQVCRAKLAGGGINEPKDDQAMDPLSPISHKPMHVSKITSVSDNVRMSTLNSRTTVANSYDRNNITGASSSTTNGSIDVW